MAVLVHLQAFLVLASHTLAEEVEVALIRGQAEVVGLVAAETAKIVVRPAVRVVLILAAGQEATLLV
jgi:hypothetical protein